MVNWKISPWFEGVSKTEPTLPFPGDLGKGPSDFLGRPCDSGSLQSADRPAIF